MGDLIDRDSVIKATCDYCDRQGHCDEICAEVELIKEVPSVKPTHPTPSNTLDELDCVSREDLTKGIETYFGDLPITVHYDMLALAQKLPSVQPDVPDINVGELISRQAAIDAIERNAYRHTYIDQIVDIINDLPSAQPRTGKWRKMQMACYGGGTITEYECSECREHHISDFDFCPTCGADMRGDKK